MSIDLIVKEDPGQRASRNDTICVVRSVAVPRASPGPLAPNRPICVVVVLRLFASPVRVPL